MQQASPSGSKSGALLLAFVAGAIGGAAGALVVMPHGSASGGVDDTGLGPSIHALDESVRALGTQVAALGRSAPLPAVHPAMPLPDVGVDTGVAADVGALLARLDEIAKQLQAHATGAGSGFAGGAARPPLQAPAAPTNPGGLAAMATEENDHHELWRRHAFWTCQQVLDAYGLPNEVTGDGTMSWYYETPGRTVHFVFFDGMVINIWN